MGATPRACCSSVGQGDGCDAHARRALAEGDRCGAHACCARTEGDRRGPHARCARTEGDRCGPVHVAHVRKAIGAAPMRVARVRKAMGAAPMRVAHVRKAMGAAPTHVAHVRKAMGAGARACLCASCTEGDGRDAHACCAQGEKAHRCEAHARSTRGRPRGSPSRPRAFRSGYGRRPLVRRTRVPLRGRRRCAPRRTRVPLGGKGDPYADARSPPGTGDPSEAHARCPSG